MARNDGTFDAPGPEGRRAEDLGIPDYRSDLGLDDWRDTSPDEKAGEPHREVIDLDAPRQPETDEAPRWSPSWDDSSDTHTFTFELPPLPPAPSVPPGPESGDARLQAEPSVGQHVLRSESQAAEPQPPRTWDIPPAPSPTSLSGAESLTADNVLKRRRPRPRSGWRKGVYALTGGKINLGRSKADRREDDLIAAARTPIAGCHHVAVISLKGGVGKTTTTAGLGAVFADMRGDRVIAVDANPDRGTLGERAPRETGATVRHLIAASGQIHSYSDVRAFTSQASTRLEVLASDADPGASRAFSEQDYRNTIATLEFFYNLIITDCGTGLLHDAMQGVLARADSLIVISSASLDGARSASATLDWLEAHGRETMARNAVVVISSVRPGGGIVDLMQLHDHFAARCRQVVTIPYDPHLEAGGIIELAELAEETRRGYLELAAAVGEGFGQATESSSSDSKARRSASSRS